MESNVVYFSCTEDGSLPEGTVWENIKEVYVASVIGYLKSDTTETRNGVDYKFVLEGE